MRGGGCGCDCSAVHASAPPPPPLCRPDLRAAASLPASTPPPRCPAAAPAYTPAFLTPPGQQAYTPASLPPSLDRIQPLPMPHPAGRHPHRHLFRQRARPVLRLWRPGHAGGVHPELPHGAPGPPLRRLAAGGDQHTRWAAASVLRACLAGWLAGWLAGPGPGPVSDLWQAGWAWAAWQSCAQARRLGGCSTSAAASSLSAPACSRCHAPAAARPHRRRPARQPGGVPGQALLGAAVAAAVRPGAYRRRRLAPAPCRARALPRCVQHSRGYTCCSARACCAQNMRLSMPWWCCASAGGGARRGALTGCPAKL